MNLQGLAEEWDAKRQQLRAAAAQPTFDVSGKDPADDDEDECSFDDKDFLEALDLLEEVQTLFMTLKAKKLVTDRRTLKAISTMAWDIEQFTEQFEPPDEDDSTNGNPAYTKE
jgi:hypothetical protein